MTATGRYQQIVDHYYGPATLGNLPGGASSVAGSSGGVGGYWINAADGGVFSFGNAQFYGSTGGMVLNQPVVGMASTHDANGYWEVASDGGVFSFGDAQFHGSTGSIHLNKPMVGMAVTPDGGGYWLVASDGGIFAYGNAQFYGSTGSIALNKPIIGMVPTHDGGGYWLIASDGGVFAFGDAGFFGSLGGAPPSTALVGVAPTPNGGGYWVLGANGSVYDFGDAPSVAISPVSPALGTLKSPMTGLIPDFSGRGLRRRERQRPGLRLRRRALFRGRDHGRAGLCGPCRGHRRHSGLTQLPGCSRHLGQPGEPPQPPERAQASGVHAVVRRVEQAQITAAVAVGPQHGLLAAVVREQAA